MRKTAVTAIGMVCAAVMTTQAQSFEVRFGIPKPAVETVLGNPFTVTNSIVTLGADDRATFRLAYTVNASDNVVVSAYTPPSGLDGKWGLEGGDDDQVQPNEWATIDNIEVIDFNANGGRMTVDDIQDLTFKAIYYDDATGSPDSGLISANGSTNTWVDFDANPSGQFAGHDPSGDGLVDLHLMTGTASVDSFYIEGLSDKHRISDITIEGSMTLLTTNYYVSTSGSDTDPGTLAQPFATIQHAVNVMLPGDTCYIRGGTYRETVDLSGVAGSSGYPITLTAYPGEEVILDGTLPISSSWTQDSGSIYKTTLSEDIWQLFVDGKMMTLARFPNARAFSDLMWDRDASRRIKRPDYSSDSEDGHVVDDPDSGAVDALEDAGVSFDGCVALLNFAPPLTTARVISNHTAGSDHFDYSPALGDKYKRHLAYYLEGGVDNAERAMLDHSEEWAYDESTKTLYLWADDGLNPDGRTIAGKNQSHFFIGDASTRYITIDGLNFFATAFKFSGSDYITVQNCDLDYCAYSKRALGSTLWAEPAFFEGSESDFCVEGTVYNCEFSYSSGAALMGHYVEDLVVENNLFYHTAYSCASRLDGNASKMVSTFDIDYSRGCVFRRNTVERSGSSQTVRIRRDYDGPVVPWVMEFNYVTDCGLLQSDGAALYSPGESVGESVARHNWMLGNKARDFRWDGANDPIVTSTNANIYRNVAMDTGNKGHISNLHPDWKADGYRLKGDFHEIYNNLAIGERSALNVAVDKGGNTNSVTRNNAAEALTPDPIPGIVNNNFIGQDEPKNMKQLLRDPDNWDFRPKAGAVELIDQGTPVTCSVDGQNIDITAGYEGTAPDLGAYEYGATEYWIPGRQLPQASMPVPPSGNRNVQLDADLMWLGGLGATSYEVYFGTDPNSLAYQGSQTNNIFSPGPLAPDTVYYWRVDSVGPNGTVMGDVWTADTTMAGPVTFVAAEDTRCDATSQNYGADDPLRIQNNQVRRMVAKFHVSGVGSVRSAILQLTVAQGPIPDIDIYGVAGDWDELTLTGENDELIWVNLMDTRSNCLAGSTYEFDVSSLVTGDGTYTLGITTDAVSSGLKINSRESGEATAPKLIVTPVDSNNPPTFNGDPIAGSPAEVDAAYSGTIAGSATDVDAGDVLSYGKRTGPAWLAVAADGVLSGIPGRQNMGLNVFSVDVTDGNGGTNTATLNISVVDTTPPASPTGLTGQGGIGEIVLDWSDNAESDWAGYTVYRGAATGGGYTAMAMDLAVSEYVDQTVLNHTVYYYVVTATDDEGNESAFSDEVSGVAGFVPVSAYSNSTILGTASGTLQDAELNDDVYQVITEELGSNKSSLNHRWHFNVVPAELVTVYVEAHHSVNSEGDDFIFRWSTNAVDYVEMFTVTNTVDNDIAQYYTLPFGISGMVYIQVKDVDRTAGHTQLDSLYVDAVFMVSEESSVPPSIAVTPVPADGATNVAVDVQLDWAAGLMAVSHDVYLGTGPEPDFQTNQFVVGFDPGMLQHNTAYTWAVDEVNNSGTTTGALWSFTTQKAPWTVLLSDDFEVGFGNWLDGGSDARLDSSFAVGTQCFAIQDNSGTSEVELGSALDLTGYSELKITFSYVVQSFENDEDFWVRFSDDGGTSWSTIKAFVNEVDFVDDGTRYYPELVIEDGSYNFTSNVKLMFECDASGNGDDVYIDDVVISVR